MMGMGALVCVCLFVIAVPGRTVRSLALFVAGLLIAAAFNFSWVADRFHLYALEKVPLLQLVSNSTVVVVANAVAITLIVVGLIRLFLIATPQQRLLRSLIARGDLRSAAEVHLKEGNLERAYKMFQKARAWHEAAGVGLQLGRDEEAAEFLRRAGGHHLGEASRVFRRCGNIASAQRCDRDFAEWLTSRGRYDEAVEAWMRAGEPKRAAGAAVIALEEGRLSSSHASLPAARRAVEQQGDHKTLARLHEVEGNWNAAAHAWRAAGEHSRAAEIFRKAGMVHDAVIAESNAGHHQEAARLRIQHLDSLRDRLTQARNRGARADEIEPLERKIEHEEEALIPQLTELGMRQEMIRLIGSSDRAEEAVEKLVERNEEAEAADLAINAHLWHVAAPLLERLNRWGEASDMYELAGEVEGAARCAERAGEDERALQLYRGLGAVDRTAHCMARLGYLQDALTELHQAHLYDDALEVLQNHPGPVPDIPQVILDLAEWARDHRSHEVAIACLQRAVAGVALQPRRLGPAIALAEELYAAGEHATALAQVERILAFDYSCEPARTLRTRIGIEHGDRSLEQGSAVSGAGTENTARSAHNRYEILNELGRGGMGVVYRARDTRLEREVAIKVLRTTSEEEAARLGQEARAAATLNHHGIVTVHDFEVGFDGYFIAMEYVPGEPLDTILKSDPVRIYNLLVPILQRVADAVAYAHDHHVIHRDLKPGNILLTPANDVKILDFGIAARLESEDGNIATVCGTPLYMAPEQIRGEPPTPATDVYAFGATAFHLATGRPPFPKGDVIDAHLNTDPPDPADLAPDLDAALGHIILRCLTKDPQQRYRDARQLCGALETLVG
jgi:tetratricopeptide (TPR) repeat protein